ncbi:MULTISPECIES: DegT/DnrJ/EryC1/StrS family aminotransferase [unclassified Bartonella]|uniref:DegT/DnrJ/EryC1/StrS family aminotransferase n=1 Tax=unclassified Bartonella TaxID=2645622 RepID=UPI0015FCFBC9|nr:MULTISPECIES: DegT/DnrJ/EryC1/StrS aminotransferase family protein [unclassified Bartonella]UXN05752.1 DegT/DnrJ/EryC1/StrS aminotransferase family protein [Bartonella sp. HY761]
MQFIDLGAQRARIEDKINAAVLKVIADGRYILGPEVAQFEKELADYIGVKHVIACANGTDALVMPLMAKGIGPGDAVFCPSFTFAATAEVIALVGAEPVFIDVLPDTYNIDTKQLKEAIQMIKKEGRLTPKAIIPVDIFGLPADYKAINAIAGEEGLFVIEDAAQSIGGKSDNTMCGAYGDVASTSFYPAKPLGCYGDGGAMFTDSDELADILRSILFHGKGETQYDNVRIGLNSRLDTIQAAILIEKLAILEDEMQKREIIGKRYNDGLKDVVKTPVIPANTRSAYAQYTIEAENRDGLRAHLQEKAIPSVIYYVKPLHLQTAYKDFARAQDSLPVSEGLAERVLSLPMHPYLSESDQDKIIEEIRAFYKK